MLDCGYRFKWNFYRGVRLSVSILIKTFKKGIALFVISKFEVIGDRFEIAIHRRGRERLQLLPHLLHAIGRHAVRDEVFPDILRVNVPLAQSRHQSAGVAGQDIGPHSAKEMDRFAGNHRDIGEHSVQSVPNAAQKLPEVRTHGLLGRTKFQCKQATRRKVVASGAEKLLGVKPIQLRGLRVRHVENDYVERAAGRLQIAPAIGVVNVYTRIRIQSRLLREEPARHIDERRIQFNIVDSLDAGVLQRLSDIPFTPPPIRSTWRGAGCSSKA